MSPEHIPSTRKVNLGEWFHPFVNYNDTPIYVEGPASFSKTFNFITPGFRPWLVILEWIQEEIDHYSRLGLPGPNIVVLLEEDRITSSSRLQTTQEYLELRLMVVGLDVEGQSDAEFDEWNYNPPPYSVRLKTPSGMEFIGRFGNADWSFLDEGELYKYDFMYIPDAALIMEQIEMKIERV